MSAIQKFFLALLPKRQADAMREESMQWQIRCCTCGNTRSYWDMGGIRWKAVSKGKRILARCTACNRIRIAAVEKIQS
jgi:hypothetical protein